MSVLREVELFTQYGQHVAIVEVPPFPDAKMPRVVIWGNRVFVNNAGFQTEGVRWSYVECFAFTSLTPPPGILRETETQVRRKTPAPMPAVRSVADVVGPSSARITIRGQQAETIGGTPFGEHTETREDGQQKDYLVLSAEERAKGFVRPVRRSYKHLTCGSVTRMSQALAETYARDPGFYAGTFCSECRTHRPVGEKGEFVWVDAPGEKVGT